MQWDTLVKKLLYWLGLSSVKPATTDSRRDEILSRPMAIDSVKGVGALHRDTTLPEWLCSQPVKVDLLDGKLLPFIFEEEEDVDLAALIRPIESAVENFLRLSPDSREELTELIYANYQEILDVSTLQPLPMRSKSDVWKYVYPDRVFVKQHPDDKNIYVVVTGDCEWEQEHGLQMVFRDGEKISSVSDVDPYW